MLDEILTELGLSDKEAKVYLAIAREKDKTVVEIAKSTKLQRTTVYDIIEKLIRRGLITKVMLNKKQSFQAVRFTKFISQIKEKEKLAYLAVKELNQLEHQKKSAYKVEVFEGKEGIKSYFEEIIGLLETNKLTEYLVLGSTLNSMKNIKLYILSQIEELTKPVKKIDFRIIWESETKDNELRKFFEKIASCKVLPPTMRAQCTTAVSNDFIALFLSIDSPIIIRISNKEIAATYKNYFDLVWNSSRESIKKQKVRII